MSVKIDFASEIADFPSYHQSELQRYCCFAGKTDTYIITDSKEQNPSSKAIKSSASPEIVCTAWNLEACYRIHKTLLLVPILSQANLAHALPSYILRSILILASHLHLGLTSGLFPSGFPTKILQVFLFSAICDTSPIHLILLDFITPKNISWAEKFMKIVIVLSDTYIMHESSTFFLEFARWICQSKKLLRDTPCFLHHSLIFSLHYFLKEIPYLH